MENDVTKPIMSKPGAGKTGNVSDLVLEHLRYIRATVDRTADDIRDIKHRVTQLEIGQATLLGADAAKSDRIDRLEHRIDTLEKRLSLRGAQ
jgi:uncharacterized protein Yka (UPF0111/DUF47 family)